MRGGEEKKKKKARLRRSIPSRSLLQCHESPTTPIFGGRERETLDGRKNACLLSSFQRFVSFAANERFSKAFQSPDNWQLLRSIINLLIFFFCRRMRFVPEKCCTNVPRGKLILHPSASIAALRLRLNL